MVDAFFCALEILNRSLWGYLGIPFIFALGFYLSYKSKWFQVRKFSWILLYFFHCVKSPQEKPHDVQGVEPLKVFFAALGGCIGIGNIVTIAFAVQIGGPGALFWVWIVALVGMILKYAEVYLGVKFRVSNGRGGYDGGPMYFVKKAFPHLTWLAPLIAFFLCIYGTEIYMFSIVRNSVVENWNIPPFPTSFCLLVLVLLGLSGGVDRIGTISSFVIPIMVFAFMLMVIFILVINIDTLPGILVDVLTSAFTGHAAIGGFAGSTMMLTVSKAISSACYSGDVGVGYASIIHAEAHTKDPHNQATLSVFGVFLDTFVVCTCTILVVLVTGVWHEDMDASLLVQSALSTHFQYMDIFMPIFLFALGYTAILTYAFAGLKCSYFLSAVHGPKVYYIYAIIAFLFFSFYDAMYALTIMNLAGIMLMLFNACAIYRLRHELSFKPQPQEVETPQES